MLIRGLWLRMCASSQQTASPAAPLVLSSIVVYNQCPCGIGRGGLAGGTAAARTEGISTSVQYAGEQRLRARACWYLQTTGAAALVTVAGGVSSSSSSSPSNFSMEALSCSAPGTRHHTSIHPSTTPLPLDPNPSLPYPLLRPPFGHPNPRCCRACGHRPQRAHPPQHPPL